MDAKVKKRWVKALRSGKYKQTKGALHSAVDGGFCCLGVLCDIECDGDWVLEGERYAIVCDYGKDDLCLPTSPGLDMSENLDIFSEESLLASMNDEGATFSEIADWIEENL